jgi:hypothetical protein
VIHIHDPIAWWRGHPQPVILRQILDAGRRDPGAALALAARGQGPKQADPRHALTTFNIPVRGTSLWHWPFTSDVDYLVCATVTRPDRSER